MLVEEEAMSGPIADAEDAEEIGFVRLDLESGVGRGVDEGASGRGLVAGVVSLVLDGLILLDEIRHEVVVPVGQRHDKFAVDLPSPRFATADDKRAPETIRILAKIV